MDEQERQALTSSTHLTPAEAGRLLGKSPARVREMIRHGELSQERVADRWLIPISDVNRIWNPSLAPRGQKKQPVANDQKPRPNNKQRQGKSAESTSSRARSVSKAPAAKKTRDLALEIERLDARMKQIDEELRDLRSGLLNDEKSERIEKLRMEKRKHGKKLQKLRTELSRRERSRQPRS